MTSVEQELDRFRVCLQTETDFTKVLNQIKHIASQFSVLEEERTLNGCFITILSLAEQFIHEHLSGNGEKRRYHDLRNGTFSSNQRFSPE